MKSGVYEIKCIKTNKSYIGSTKNFNHRKTRHFSQLRTNKHGNKKLQEDFNLYSIDNFEFNIIEEVEEDKLLEREQYYMDLFKSYDNGYNVSKYSDSTKGLNLTEEHKNKISNSMTGRKQTEEHAAKNRGGNNGKAVSLDKAIEVKKLLDNGVSNRKTAEIANVSVSLVKAIRKGTHWSCQKNS